MADIHMPKQTPSIGMVASMDELGSDVYTSEVKKHPTPALPAGQVRTEAKKILEKLMTFIANGQTIKKGP